MLYILLLEGTHEIHAARVNFILERGWILLNHDRAVTDVF